MTTIAYKDGLMACDSCWTDGPDYIELLATKIFRLPSGALLGQAGQNDGRAVVELLAQVKSHKKLPSYQDICAVRASTSCLLVLPSGRIFKVATTLVCPEQWDAAFEAENSDGVGMWEVTTPAACGSGRDAALSAMRAGKTAREAVAIACGIDLNSRPPIHVVPLKATGRLSKKGTLPL